MRVPRGNSATGTAWLIVGGLLLTSSVCTAEDGSYTVRRKPFSLTEEYEIQEHGRTTGTIRQKPFSLTPEYEVRDERGRTEGTYRKKPFSLNEEWEFKPGY